MHILHQEDAYETKDDKEEHYNKAIIYKFNLQTIAFEMVNIKYGNLRSEMRMRLELNFFTVGR